MNSSEHFKAAERLLEKAETEMKKISSGSPAYQANLIAMAQAHIQIAVAQGFGAVVDKYLGAR